MEEKMVLVTTGSSLIRTVVEMKVRMGKLTPNMARHLALRAVGHTDRVTVCDGECAYRLYRHSARKIQAFYWRWMVCDGE
jgi:hypothetical protein